MRVVTLLSVALKTLAGSIQRRYSKKRVVAVVSVLSVALIALGIFMWGLNVAPEPPGVPMPSPAEEPEPSVSVPGPVEEPVPTEPPRAPITLSYLASYLEYDILTVMNAFEHKHLLPIEGELFHTHIRMQFGRGGNYQIDQNITFEPVYTAIEYVEDAVSLMNTGKRVGETGQSDAHDAAIKEEVAKLVENAKQLFQTQIANSFQDETDITDYVTQPEPRPGWGKRAWEEINNEEMVIDIIEQYEEYRQGMEEIVELIDTFLTKLSKSQAEHSL